LKDPTGIKSSKKGGGGEGSEAQKNKRGQKIPRSENARNKEINRNAKVTEAMRRDGESNNEAMGSKNWQSGNVDVKQ